MKPSVGERVRVERDEKRYPSRGTWPQFRGRTGTVVEINKDHKRPRLTEYGVVFGKGQPRTDHPHLYKWSGDEPITWFKAYEISVLASQRHTEPLSGNPAIEGTPELVASCRAPSGNS